ncbi:response regulator transcription factor [Planosporangium thailandense]|uniref:Response regulator transcription factor n=1 Tax=Planosporangium thailandense TaxID=765197 RepID=A0ABX0Y131_9ACTN|nr:response regulator transcription factor [Planosporangium thailandense]
MIRVLVVDDQALVRAGVTALLRAAGHEVVGEAADGHEAVRLAERLRPDVVLMDIRMPRVDGVEATRRIVTALPATRVVMLTTFDDDAEVYGALQAGAVGYLVKDGEPTAMLEAVARAGQGEPLLAPRVLARIVGRALQAHEQSTAGHPAAPATLSALTTRERQVLALVGAGLSNAEIGRALHLGVTTVKTHVSAAMVKLGLRNRVQAAVAAHRLGLVDDDFRVRHDPEEFAGP